MILTNPSTWETATGVVLLAALTGAGIWLLTRRRPTADEIEQARRQFLARSGRLVDGMFLDITEMTAEDRVTRTLLIYSYRIGGVDYQCSQDVTTMRDALNPSDLRAGFPCTVRYQPGNPHNSILVAEQWSGLRNTLPELPVGRAVTEPRRRWPRAR
jgi:hypothetical protein